MYISDKFLYLELQKTAGTHILKLLQQFTVGDIKGKHNQSNEIERKHRKVLGSIRNPFEWYLSLWAYGCNSQGGLRNRIKKKRKLKTILFPFQNSFILNSNVLQSLNKNLKRPNYEYLYEDVENACLFKEWLELILKSDDFKFFVKEGYFDHSISNKFGLLTHRYLSLYTKNYLNIYNKKFNNHDLLAFYKRNIIVDFFIKKESLEEDLFSFLNSLNIIEEKISINDFKLEKTNTSKHRNLDYYYDEKTFNLVREKDFLIFEIHGY